MRNEKPPNMSLYNSVSFSCDSNLKIRGVSGKNVSLHGQPSLGCHVRIEFIAFSNRKLQGAQTGIKRIWTILGGGVQMHFIPFWMGITVS